MRLGFTIIVFGGICKAIKSKLTYNSHVNSDKLFNDCEMPSQYSSIVVQLAVK
jgi:hypothetical protein